MRATTTPSPPTRRPTCPTARLAIFDNITSYTRGINGIMVDLAGGGTHASISASDFVFKVGNNNTPSSWAAGPATPTVSVRIGARRRWLGPRRDHLGQRLDQEQVAGSAGAADGQHRPDRDRRVLLGQQGRRHRRPSSDRLSARSVAGTAATFSPTLAVAAANHQRLGHQPQQQRDGVRRSRATSCPTWEPLPGSKSAAAAHLRPRAGGGDGDAGISSALAATATSASTMSASSAAPDLVSSSSSPQPNNADASNVRIAASFWQLSAESLRQSGQTRWLGDQLIDAADLDEDLLDSLVASGPAA